MIMAPGAEFRDDIRNGVLWCHHLLFRDAFAAVTDLYHGEKFC